MFQKIQNPNFVKISSRNLRFPGFVKGNGNINKQIFT